MFEKTIYQEDPNKTKSNVIYYLVGVFLFSIGMVSLTFNKIGNLIVVLSFIFILISIVLQTKQQGTPSEIITRMIYLIVFFILYRVVTFFILQLDVISKTLP